VQELAQQQGIAGCRLVAGGAKRIVGIRREPFAHEPRCRLGGQRRGPNDARERIDEDPRQEVRILSLLGPQPDDDAHGEPLHPRQEVGEEAQRGQVGPVQVVEREQQRSVRGEVRRQPVEPVQSREGRVRRRFGGDLSRVEEPLG
jgi:hypothetical protein